MGQKKKKFALEQADEQETFLCHGIIFVIWLGDFPCIVFSPLCSVFTLFTAVTPLWPWTFVPWTCEKKKKMTLRQCVFQNQLKVLRLQLFLISLCPVLGCAIPTEHTSFGWRLWECCGKYTALNSNRTLTGAPNSCFHVFSWCHDVVLASFSNCSFDQMECVLNPYLNTRCSVMGLDITGAVANLARPWKANIAGCGF